MFTCSQVGNLSATGTTAVSSQPRCPVTGSASSDGPASSVSVLVAISSSWRRPRASPLRSSVSGGGGRLGVLTRSTMPEDGRECQRVITRSYVLRARGPGYLRTRRRTAVRRPAGGARPRRANAGITKTTLLTVINPSNLLYLLDRVAFA